MAETKTRASRGSASSRKHKPAKARKSTAAKSRKRTTSQASRNGVARAGGARKAVESTAKQAGNTVGDAGRNLGRAAAKAKAPLLAGGAAMAGAAGGIALGARRARKSKAPNRPKIKIRSQDLARAARDVGQFGMDVGQLAAELRKNREEAHGAKRRSPIEVVLDGLTHRQNSS